MSAGPARARAEARGPDWAAAVVGTSSACETAFPQAAAAAPRTGTGGRGPWRARSARVMTIAAAPSVTRQQSFTESGLLITRDSRQSSIVSGPFAKASGLPFAHPLAATEIGRASCRERVCQYV